jgi:ribose-phosphate pyrophosphokinase
LGIPTAIEAAGRKRLVLMAGRAHPELASDIASQLGVALSDPRITDFASGEIRCRFDESVRGSDVFIVQTHAGRVNDAIMEQLILIDAAKRASAKRITAVCPYFGYGRQDRKSAGREPITAKLLADLFASAGADRIMSVDLHTGQIQGFFDGPWDHLLAWPLFVKYLEDNAPADVVMVAADAGRVKLAELYSAHLPKSDLAIVYKRRDKNEAHAVQAREIVGDVAGRTCVIAEDMIDTGGTIVAASDLLMEQGASEVWALATHGLFSDPATDRLKNSSMSKVIVTDSVPIPAEKRHDKLEVVSAASLLADAIRAVFEDTSVSSIFGGENQY